MRVRPRRLTVLTWTTAVITASVAAPALWTSSADARAPRASASVTLDRTIHNDAVVESSGLARSTYARRLLWTHNDKGDSPRLFGIGSRGDTRAVVKLSGARSIDWEDIASGPDHALWVADIGDNAGSRSYISVYRVTEPEVLANGDLSATRYDFTYPDGRHDAEALMVDPRDGRVYIVSKERDGGAIYRAPLELATDGSNPLTEVASAPANITGASFAPDGSWFVLCNYSSAYVYTELGSTPRRVAKPDLEQGESIEVDRDGAAFFVGSEGADSPVYRVPVP
jgi:hypothetical protein